LHGFLVLQEFMVESHVIPTINGNVFAVVEFLETGRARFQVCPESRRDSIKVARDGVLVGVGRYRRSFSKSR